MRRVDPMTAWTSKEIMLIKLFTDSPMEDLYTISIGLSTNAIRRNNCHLVQLFSIYLKLMPDAIDGDMVTKLSYFPRRNIRAFS